MQLLLLALFSFFGKLCLANCLETRGAIDIGSRRTKFKLAQIDICKDRILKVYLHYTRSIAYAEDALANQMELSDKTMMAGRDTIQGLLKKSVS